MEQIPPEQILRRMRVENPWWTAPHQIAPNYRDLKPRAYFDQLWPLVNMKEVRRAVILMGPRRVGKTVLIHHCVAAFLKREIPPTTICYISVDHPIYNGLRLEQLVEHFAMASGTAVDKEEAIIFFDEIQYLRGWETQLKILVDEKPKLKFVASGSAAAALKLKSTESGAGRFTDFLLPPLTFHEYITLLGKDDIIEPPPEDGEEDPGPFRTADIKELNHLFLDYVNFGGYPEVALSGAIQSDPYRYIKSDIIDKVLLRDLPGLYGISDIQELNYLFTTLAFNTAQEVSLEGLAQNSGVAKNTLKRYMEYLEAAFLIKAVHRVDKLSKRFKRANYFKIYLTNSSMRSALFSPVELDDASMGHLAETAIFSQWFHSDATLYYARWKNGEVDIVNLGIDEPAWAVEVKWSDRYFKRPDRLVSLLSYCNANDLRNVCVTTKTMSGTKVCSGVPIVFVPASIYCYTVGYNVIQKGRNLLEQGLAERPVPPPLPANPT